MRGCVVAHDLKKSNLIIFYIKIGKFKAITGGDEIQAKELYQKSKTFRSKVVLGVAANVYMRINTQDKGTWRRMRVVDFESCFVDTIIYGKDEDGFEFPEKYITDFGEFPIEEGDSIFLKDKSLESKFSRFLQPLLWLLVTTLWKYGAVISTPQFIKDKTEEYKKSQDLLGTFIEESLIFETNRKISSKILGILFKNYIANKMIRLKFTDLHELLLFKGAIFKDGYYYGVREIEMEINIIETPVESFKRLFQESFQITNNEKDYVYVAYIEKWAKEKNLDIHSNININPILKECYGLDRNNKEHCNNSRKNGANGSYKWIGMKHIDTLQSPSLKRFEVENTTTGLLFIIVL